MKQRGASSLVVVLLLAALAALAWLFVGGGLDTLGFNQSGPGAQDDGDVDLLDGSEGKTTAGDEDAARTALATGVGDGKGGGIVAHLAWVADGQPVEGAQVNLLGTRGVSIQELVTDGAGALRFQDLVPGPRYSLRIRGEGFADVRIHGIRVVGGATTDLGQLHLGEHVVLRGRVVDATGRPVPFSSVSAHAMRTDLLKRGMMDARIEAAYGEVIPQAAVESDDGGWFTISTLADGRYRLEARASGYATDYQTDVLVRGDRSAAPLTLVLGRSVAAKGTVKDDEGKPIAGARVRAIRSTGRRMSFTGQIEREETVTDASGRYVLDSLAFGNNYRFAVIAEGHPPIADFAEVEAMRPIKKDFVVARGGFLEGKIMQAGTDKPVAGATLTISTGNIGAMMGGRRRGAGTSSVTGSSIVRTDDAGRYELGPVHAGPILSLTIKAAGFQTKSFMPWPQPHGLPDVAPGERQTLDIEMLRGGQITGTIVDDGGQPVAGATVEANSAGGRWGGGAGIWLGTPTATSGADGAYAIEGVSPGTYRVTARAPGFAETSPEEQVEITAAGNTESIKVELTGAGQLVGVVTDPEGEPVAGATVRAKGQAVEGGRGGGRGRGMMRRLREMQNPSLAVTDDEGRFVLDGLGPNYKWVAIASATGLVDAESEPVRLDVGEKREVEIQLLPGARFAGRVHHEDGRPFAGARVRIGTLSDEQARRVSLSSWEAERLLGDPTVTDDDGRFEIDDVAPGRLIVRVEGEGYVPFFKRNVTIDVGGVYDSYVATLVEGATLKGRVLGADGKPVTGCGVMASTSGIRQGRGGNRELAPEGESGGDEISPSLFSVTDAQGTYEIENVPPGVYTVYVRWAQGYKTGATDPEHASRANVSVPGAEPIEFKLQKAEESPGGPGGRRGR